MFAQHGKESQLSEGKKARVFKTSLSGKRLVYGGLTQRAWSSLTLLANVIATKNTVLIVNLRVQLCMGSNGEHIKKTHLGPTGA